jgi:hypothetical protein
MLHGKISRAVKDIRHLWWESRICWWDIQRSEQGQTRSILAILIGPDEFLWATKLHFEGAVRILKFWLHADVWHDVAGNVRSLLAPSIDMIYILQSESALPTNTTSALNKATYNRWTQLISPTLSNPPFPLQSRPPTLLAYETLASFSHFHSTMYIYYHQYITATVMQTPNQVNCRQEHTKPPP